MFRFLLLASWLLVCTTRAFACEIEYTVNLETSGERVRIELRTGSPGRSRVVATKVSSGGQVYFPALCAGSYFTAIGNDESVSVTPVRYFEDQHSYTSRITLQRGTGNVQRMKRGAL